MVSLVEVQELRINRFLEKEKEMPIPMTVLSDLLNDYAELLMKLQKMRFDLGLDEYKGANFAGRVTTTKTLLPDGSQEQKTVMEAMAVMGNVFTTRGIGNGIDLATARS
jgi:hypothetical protein